MYGNFTWWQGVVEDRNDPLKLGRCRVRVFGYHVDDLDEIPTEELPWATPMQPITSAAMNGIGTTPMGPVEGTWVFGFWRDGKNAQEPVIIGTVGGKMDKDDKKDSSRGFNDPDGIYPRSEFIGEADTNRLARGIGKLPVGSMNGENAQSLVHKRGSRRRGDPQAGWAVTNTGVPMGVAGNLWDTEAKRGTIENTDDGNLKVANETHDSPPDGHYPDENHYMNDYWNEPNPRYGGGSKEQADSDLIYLPSVKNSSQYPHNHVRMSEGGHVEEWDDTPTAERLHRYHRSGTFEEIQPDGTRVVKIVGRDYEIVAKRKNVYIQGTCNITIDGDCRMLYRSDLVQEVVGDYHLHVGGEMRTKIIGNDAKEVMVDRKITVNGNDDLFVAKNQIIHIGQDALEEITGHLDQTVKKHVTATYGIGAVADTISHAGAGYTPPGNYTINVSGKTFFTSIGTYTLTSKADMKINTDSNLNINVKINCMIDIDGYRTEDVQEYSTMHIGQYSTLDVGTYLEEDIGSYWTVDTGSTIDITGGGDITVIGGPNIKLNP